MRRLIVGERFERGLRGLDNVPQKATFLRAIRWAVLTNPEALHRVPGSNPPIYIIKSDQMKVEGGGLVRAWVWVRVTDDEATFLVMDVQPE
jgi:hypothetical protein